MLGVLQGLFLPIWSFYRKSGSITSVLAMDEIFVQVLRFRCPHVMQSHSPIVHQIRSIPT